MKKYNVAIVGVTGAVGKKMVEMLELRKFPVNRFLPLASKHSTGKTVSFNGQNYTVIEAAPDSFDGIDIALFSAGGNVSAILAHEAVKRGALVIDNTSYFRMNEEVPLVVPEVNPSDIHTHKGIIANPNCSTIQMVHTLKPIHDVYKIKRIVVSTYQAVSGTGTKAIQELKTQTADTVVGNDIDIKVYPKQIAFNVLPHIDAFMDNGFTKEEMKMINETKKILHDNSIEVNATCVRVPVIQGHSESVYIETEREIDLENIYKLLGSTDGIVLQDLSKPLDYPTPLEAENKEETFVGRIRKDLYKPNAISLWIVSDNLLKGAALNAVQIAEFITKQ